MDGNINEMSPHLNKSPNLDFDTPEIDKLKSLAVTPSSSLDSSPDNLDNTSKVCRN